MSAPTITPDTIVFVHGFWVTPRSWESSMARFEARGYRVLAPAYPGFEVEVEALNADPTPIENVRVPDIIAHFEEVIGELDRHRSSLDTRRAAPSRRSSSTMAMARQESL